MLENKNWQKITYLNFQDKKEFNFSSGKKNDTPLIPISTNVFSYLLLNKLTQIQTKNIINSGNNEYFLAKAVNIQKEKHMSNQRLLIFLNQNNVKKTENINYTKIGYNQFSLFNMFSLMKKDRFFLNDKFYQDILGKRAFNIYKGGIFGYEKNLKILKKYNEYFERQIYLMSEKVDDFLGKNTAFIKNKPTTASVARYASEKTPLMGWTHTTTGRGYLEIWKRLNNTKIASIRPNAETFYLDEKNILNVEDLSLLALKNLRDYELYFGMVFYKKEIKKYLSRVGVGRGMYLSVFSRNATRFNFLKDAGYKRTSTNYRIGVATKFGLLRTLYTKKHFPKNSLDFENVYSSFSFFNTESAIKFNQKTTANAGKFNRVTQPKELVKVLALRKDSRVLLRQTGGKFTFIKKSLVKKQSASKTQVVKINLKRKTQVKKNKVGACVFLRKINAKSVTLLKNSKMRPSVVINASTKLNMIQLRTLLVTTLFRSLTNLNLNRFFLVKMKKDGEWQRDVAQFTSFSRRSWKKNICSSHPDPLMVSGLYTLRRLKIGADVVPEVVENFSNYKMKISSALSNNTKVLNGASFAISSFPYILRGRSPKKKTVWGLLNLKAFTYKRERLLLKKLVNYQNKNTTLTLKTAEDLKSVYADFKKNKVSSRKRFTTKFPTILEKSKKLNKNLLKYKLLKTKSLLESFLGETITGNASIRDRNIKKLVKNRAYITRSYKAYRLSRMFELGMSHRVNSRARLTYKKSKNIVLGTIAGRKRLAKYIGNGSNIKVGGNTLVAFRNKIGKNTVLFDLGLTYRNAKKINLLSVNNIKFNLKFKFLRGLTTNKLSAPAVVRGLDVVIVKKDVKPITYSNYGRPATSPFLKNTRSSEFLRQIKVLKLQNINLIKKYLGLTMYTESMQAAKILKLNLTEYFSIKKKYKYANFSDIRKEINRQQAKRELKKNKKKLIRIMAERALNRKIRKIRKRRKVFLNLKNKYKAKFKLRSLNLELLNKKLGLDPQSLNLLKIHDHGFSLNDHYNYQINHLNNANRVSEHYFVGGNNPRTVNTSKIENDVKLPTPISLDSISKTNSGAVDIKFMTENAYNLVDAVLESKQFALRGKTKRATFFIDNFPSYWGVSDKTLSPLEKRDRENYALASFWWRKKKLKNVYKMWEDDMSNILGNTMRRLGKFSKNEKKGFLRIRSWRRFNFLGRRSIKWHLKKSQSISAKNSVRKLRVEKNKISTLAVVKKYRPFRVSGVARIKQLMATAPFLRDVKAKYRNDKILRNAVEMNDVENDGYSSTVFLWRTAHSAIFKANHQLQQKVWVFGKNATKDNREMDFQDRNVRAKYTRKLYNQFARRRFPVFWYRIARKKYPLKSQKKEWGIKIPLAERFIFPFDTQVWNTTYDSSVVYYNNIGWLNFTKNIRRFQNLAHFYRYGREHDDMITGVPFTTPTGYFEPMCTDEAYDKFLDSRQTNMSVFRSEFATKGPNRAAVKPLAIEYFKKFGEDTLRTFNYKFMAYRDTLKIWHAKMKPLLGFFGLKTYYTYNSYLMRLNNEVKTRRYRTLFSNFAFAFKLNKTEFTRNITYFNFTEFASSVFRGYRAKVFGKLVLDVIMFKSAFAWVARTFTSKYKYFNYSAFLKIADHFEGKQLGESLVKTNSDYYSNDLNLVSNPIIYAKNNSLFVETYSKFRYRNKMLKSSQNLQFRFMDQEARLGFKTFSAKNLVW